MGGVGWIEYELGDMVLLRGSTPPLLVFSSSRRAAITLPCDMSLANFLGLGCWWLESLGVKPNENVFGSFDFLVLMCQYHLSAMRPDAFQGRQHAHRFLILHGVSAIEVLALLLLLEGLLTPCLSLHHKHVKNEMPAFQEKVTVPVNCFSVC